MNKLSFAIGILSWKGYDSLETDWRKDNDFFVFVFLTSPGVLICHFFKTKNKTIEHSNTA